MDSNLIVILNDNEMSIDPNVGAMADYLSRARSNPTYTKSKEEVEEILKKFRLSAANCLKQRIL